MDNTRNHPDLKNFGHMMNVGETDLDHYVGQDIYVRREPEDLPQYTIMYNGVSVRREISHWDADKQDVVFLDRPEKRTVRHTQRVYGGDIALRAYTNEDDFGMPVRVENVVLIS